MPNIKSAISGAISIGGPIIGGKSSKKAAKAQERAAQQAEATKREQIAQNKEFFDTTRADLEPWRQSGAKAQSRLDYLLGLSSEVPIPSYNEWLADNPAPQFSGFPNIQSMNTDRRSEYNNYITGLKAGNLKARQSERGGDFGSLTDNFTYRDFRADPGYKFRLNEGLKGIDRAAASRGGYDSGATLKALSRFNQDYASDEYGKAWSRDNAQRNRLYDYLFNVSGSGQNAGARVGSLGTSMMNINSGINDGISDLQTQTGNIRGANAINQGNIRNEVLGNIGSLAQKYLDRPPVQFDPILRGFGNGNQLPGAFYRG